MNEENTGKNIRLINFNLEPIELEKAKKILEKYEKKINEKVNCKELRIRLKTSRKGKTFLHEIDANAITDKKGVLAAKSTGFHIFALIAKTLNKIFEQAEHKQKYNETI
jgi:hypothetical protein